VPSRIPLGFAEPLDRRRAEIAEALKPGFEAADPPPHYHFIVPVRNAEEWIGRCLDSIRVQLGNWTCYVADDASTDGTCGIINDRIARSVDGRIKLIQNAERKGPLRNTVDTIRSIAMNPEDVIVQVDGDDWLTDENILDTLNSYYTRGAWMTYGSFRQSNGKPSWFPAYPLRVLHDGGVRNYRFCATHLRTFKRFLFDQLTDADFLDDDGTWFMTAGDVALYLPMLDLARERALHVEEVLYIYNVDNPASDHVTGPVEQVETRNRICSRPARARLTR
jgi:glycosyltransferase involved in cell wall biosynthesis